MKNKVYENLYSPDYIRNNRKVFRLEVGDIVVQNNGTGYFIREGIKDVDSQFSEFRTVEYLLEQGKIKFKDVVNKKDRYDVIEHCDVYVQTGILSITTLEMM